MPSCLQKIRASLPQLTPVERRIANFILEDPELIPTLSVDALAKNTGTAKSAVIRCCHTVGYTGYAALKLALVKENSRRDALHFVSGVTPTDTPGEILDKVFAATVKSLHDTAEQIDRKALSALVAMLAGAGHIYIYAIGSSSALAEELGYRLMTLGYTALVYTDVPTMKISSMNILPDDVAIGISFSGRTEAPLEAMALAEKAGAACAAIVGDPESPLAKAVSLCLAVSSDELAYPTEAMFARLAQMCLIDALTVALSARRYDDTVARSARMHALVDTERVFDTTDKK